MKKEQILSFIQDINTPCKTAEIAMRFDMSVYQARHYLTCLEKEGKIRRTPLRRGARTLWEVVRETEKH
ncbi:FaeA/PapI family transcriptional regulator [Escherichia coli]|uniref:FaeA/PapI family transcriptional regulator n=1 Tax=Escherichia coli TaxID=562 RepID=UPI000B7ED9FF|nr:FaeA/PapI family transcriptional regulator [Escherichia coli]